MFLVHLKNKSVIDNKIIDKIEIGFFLVAQQRTYKNVVLNKSRYLSNTILDIIIAIGIFVNDFCLFPDITDNVNRV